MNINPRMLPGLALAVAALPGLAAAAGDEPLEPGDLLATTGVDDKLIVINPETGNGTLRALIGNFGSVTDIAFCQGGFIGSIGAGRSLLINMDPQTGEEHFRCVHEEGRLTALECVGDSLIGAFIIAPDGPSILVEVAPPDVQDFCVLIPLGPGVGDGTTGFGALGGIALNPATGQMVGCETRVTPPATSRLIELDLSTGAGAVIGDTGLSRCGALAFSPQPEPPSRGIDLPLYAGVGAADPNAGSFYEIIEQTGQAVFIGHTQFDGISGLAFLPPPPDADEDGILDFEDNCVFFFNPGQEDSNLDGFGNACDADLTGDCTVNFADLALLKAAFLSEPGDPNWNPDADFNSDAMVNFGDVARMKQTFFNGDQPGPGPSGVPNDCMPNLQVRLINPPVDVTCSGMPVTCLHAVDLEVLEVNGRPVDQPFDVTVFSDNGLSHTIGIPPLPPGAVFPTSAVLGPGDNCYNPDCQITAEVDSGGVIVESDETDNTDTRLDIG